MRKSKFYPIKCQIFCKCALTLFILITYNIYPPTVVTLTLGFLDVFALMSSLFFKEKKERSESREWRGIIRTQETE